MQHRAEEGLPILLRLHIDCKVQFQAARALLHALFRAANVAEEPGRFQFTVQLFEFLLLMHNGPDYNEFLLARHYGDTDAAEALRRRHMDYQ